MELLRKLKGDHRVTRCRQIDDTGTGFGSGRPSEGALLCDLASVVTVSIGRETEKHRVTQCGPLLFHQPGSLHNPLRGNLEHFGSSDHRASRENAVEPQFPCQTSPYSQGPHERNSEILEETGSTKAEAVASFLGLSLRPGLVPTPESDTEILGRGKPSYY